MIDVREPLFQTLTELSSLYPEMRFGQLLEFACTLAGDESPASVEEVRDAGVLAAVRKHIRKRSSQLGREKHSGGTYWTPRNVELFQLLRELSDRHPHRRLGQLLAQIADLAQVNLYDIEDKQLADAVRKHLDPKVTT